MTEPQTSTPPANPILRAVIIDDEAWTRDAIKRIGSWRHLGIRIAGEASDGKSGIECIMQARPHIIITDMRMPGIDGAQMLKLMGAQGIQAKIIIISGYSDYHYTRQALASQAVDYLPKPVDPEEFNRVLAQCVAEIQSNAQVQPEAGTPPMLHQHLDSPWLQSYRQARQDYRNSLETLALQGIETAAHTLRGLFETAQQDIRLTLLVKINQDLQGIIDETLAGASTEIAASRDFSPGQLSFAIGGTTTIESLIAHHTRIASRYIDARVQENQRKQRLDISAVRAYIDTHYTERISLEALADSFHASKEYLSTLFRKETGETFTDYITRLRMEQARQLITSHHIPLKRVPELVGYIDIPHFHRTFKRYFGTTPGTMRRLGIDGPENGHTH